jgi:hypothetical protein
VSNTPSDAEISAVIAAAKVKCVHPEAATTIDIARAVLAKWGAPQPVAKPVGFANAGQLSNLSDGYAYIYPKKVTGASVALYTAPQPVVREPFTKAQQERLHQNRPANVGKGISLADWRRAVEFIEAAHGIKKKGGAQ